MSSYIDSPARIPPVEDPGRAINITGHAFVPDFSTSALYFYDKPDIIKEPLSIAIQVIRLGMASEVSHSFQALFCPVTDSICL